LEKNVIDGLCSVKGSEVLNYFINSGLKVEYNSLLLIEYFLVLSEKKELLVKKLKRVFSRGNFKKKRVSKIF